MCRKIKSVFRGVGGMERKYPDEGSGLRASEGRERPDGTPLWTGYKARRARLNSTEKGARNGPYACKRR